MEYCDQPNRWTYEPESEFIVELQTGLCLTAHNRSVTLEKCDRQISRWSQTWTLKFRNAVPTFFPEKALGTNAEFRQKQEAVTVRR